jgi:Arc/MetJ-type ribon-helix-helix transcriptional regulator
MKDTRPRMISLRLSEEEFDSFGELVALHGFESISDLVRNAVARLRSEPVPPSLDTRLAEIRGRMELMDGRLESLAHVVESNAVKLASPPNFRGVTCVNSACGQCERCNWERDKGLRA